jgi:hypothetical protein
MTNLERIVVAFIHNLSTMLADFSADLKESLEGEPLDPPVVSPPLEPPVISPPENPAGVEVGMWYCEPTEGISAFNSDLGQLALGGVTTIQSWDAGQIYANSQGIPPDNWAEHQGKGWGGWVNHLARINQANNTNLSTLLFKPIWAPVASGKRKIEEVKEMIKAFRAEATPEGASVVRGIDLGDDFAKYDRGLKWNPLITAIGEAFDGSPPPFYLTNQMYDTRIYSHNSPAGSKMAALRSWFAQIRRGGFVGVYLPQYYPWVGMDWHPDKLTHWSEWLEEGLKECLAQKRFLGESLQVMPILQASAWGQSTRGPSGEEMKRQLQISLSLEGIKGVWLIGWNNPSFPGFTAHWDSSEHWGEGRKYDEAVREVVASLGEEGEGNG